MKVLKYLAIALCLLMVSSVIMASEETEQDEQKQTRREERRSSRSHHRRHGKREHLPAGNYKNSCRNCEVNDGVLRCECRENTLILFGGDYIDTELELDPDLKKPIINDHGTLVYDRGLLSPLGYI